jgi:branched-chain amino acid transport system ATP-binding protein
VTEPASKQAVRIGAGDDDSSILTIRGLKKHFSGVAALDSIDLEVKRGEILAILGPNGSGKTTLFNVISGFMSPTAGQIVLDGRTIGGKDVRHIVRMGLSRSFQQSMCCASFSVRENLMLGRTFGGRHRRSIDIDALLLRCGLDQVADVPSGKLPYGIQRKLGVAMALSTGPRIVLLDEPGAGLSVQDSAELAEMIRALPPTGVTVVCIDHNLPFLLPIANRVAVLDAGRKIFEGTPAAARMAPAVIEAYLGS